MGKNSQNFLWNFGKQGKMNPYTYQRKAKCLSVDGKAGQPAKGPSFLKSILSYKLNSAITLSMVLFFASAVGAVALVANTEISSENYQPFTQQSNSKQQVLGIASYGYNQPSCNRGKTACLNHALINYSGEGWQVRIDYELPTGMTGYVRVNGWKFMDGISSYGSGYTGYDLLPGKTYQFVLWGKYSGRYYSKLAVLNLTAPKAPEPIACSQWVVPTGCYIDYARYECGEVVCPPTPSYGYQTVDVGSVSSGSWREGWIESVSYGSMSAPGNLKVFGWAYSDDVLVKPSFSLRNLDTGVEYSGDSVSYSTYRYDVLSYLTGKIGHAPSFQNGSFIIQFSNLPVGKYQIYNARYGTADFNFSYLFNIHNQTTQPIVIYSPASYGYAGALNIYTPTSASVGSSIQAGATGAELLSFEVSNSNGSGPYSLNSIAFLVSDPLALQGIGNHWIVDEYGTVIAKADLSKAPNVETGYNIIFNTPLYVGVNQVRHLKLKANILAFAPSATFKFQALNIGYQFPYPPNYSFPQQVNGLGSWMSPTISIVPASAQSSIKVISPNGGESWANVIGNSYQITWTNTTGKSVRIELLKGDNFVEYRGPISSTQTSYTWTFNSSNYQAGSDYKISVTSLDATGAADYQYFDKSDAPFTISSTSVGLSTTGTGTSFRYLAISSPASNSWVAWREVEFYDKSGNKVVPISASVSSTYSNSTYQRAYDADINTVWNSGVYNGKIIFDLGSVKEISKIRLLPANYPNPATVTHNLLYSSDNSSYTTLTSFTGPIYDNQWLTFVPSK